MRRECEQPDKSTARSSHLCLLRLFFLVSVAFVDKLSIMFRLLNMDNGKHFAHKVMNYGRLNRKSTPSTPTRVSLNKPDVIHLHK